MTWTDPIRDDTTIYPGEGGFISMSIYANNLPATYFTAPTAPRGWSNWAMNGGHTSWAADCPIEAIQIRLNGVFGNSFDVYYCATLSDGTVCDWSKRRNERSHGLRTLHYRPAFFPLGQRHGRRCL